MLKQLLSAINDCAWAYKPITGSVVFISPNIKQVIGITADELMADPGIWNKMILPADKEAVFTATESLKMNDWAEFSYRIKVAGQTKWLFEKRTRFLDEESQAEIVLALIRDVSDEKPISNRLKNALGDFSVLFDSSHTPMWIYETPSLRIIKVNNAAIEHYGYAEDEFLSMTIRDIRPKIDLAAFNEYIFRRGITKGKKVGTNNGGIWRHQNKAGEIIYAEISGYEVKYGNSTCRIIIATDVTERVLFEQEKEVDIKNSQLQG
jgi:PAS domain S-box-containing protein